jgi:hypothetical protein
MAQARIQFRRGTATEWTSANPTLAVGELGLETDTSKFKIGDGSTAWTSLAYSFTPFTADSPITITDGVIGIDEGNITIAQSQVTGLETDLSDKQDVVSGVSDTQIGYLSGVTSDIQTQIDGKQTIVSGVSDTEIGYLDGVTSSIQTQLDGKLALTGGTLTGALTLNADPTQALHATTKQYVDSLTEGLRAKPAAEAATTANLVSTYNNGASGVGATLTSTTNGAFPTIDGHSGWSLSDGVLVKDQTDAAENGRYIITTLGDAETPWVITRCELCDTATEIPGMYVFVVDGTVNAGTGWVATVADAETFIVGTDDIVFAQFSGAGTFTAGNGLELTANQFSVDTDVIAPLASPSFTGTVVLPNTTSIGDVSSTEIGHLDGVTSAIQTQLNAKASASELTNGLATKQDIVAGVSDTEIGYLDGVTSPIQTQLNSKQATITGGATTITSSNLTASRALVSDASGKVSVSAVTSTELGFVDGVTSAIQTQLNGKSPLAGSTSITTVGTVTTVTSPTAAGSAGLRKTTISTANPTGGADGDVWLKYS